jgi:hypothetical protein
MFLENKHNNKERRKEEGKQSVGRKKKRRGFREQTRELLNLDVKTFYQNNLLKISNRW